MLSPNLCLDRWILLSAKWLNPKPEDRRQIETTKISNGKPAWRTRGNPKSWASLTEQSLIKEACMQGHSQTSSHKMQGRPRRQVWHHLLLRQQQKWQPMPTLSACAHRSHGDKENGPRKRHLLHKRPYWDKPHLHRSLLRTFIYLVFNMFKTHGSGIFFHCLSLYMEIMFLANDSNDYIENS